MTPFHLVEAQRARSADSGVVIADRLLSQPLFLVGAERSGTTLLRLLLDRHHELSWHGEFEFAVDLISDEGSWPERETLVEHLQRDRVFNHWELRIPDRDDPREILHDFLIQFRQRGARPFLGATIHRHLDRIPTVWPNARYIHIVRDPRDVASSMVAMGWDGNMWTAIDRWIEVEESWARLRDRLDPNIWIKVHFEQLIQSPQLKIYRLCRLIGVDYEPSMTKSRDGSAYSTPDLSLIEQCRPKLSSREVQSINRVEGRRDNARARLRTDRSRCEASRTCHDHA